MPDKIVYVIDDDAAMRDSLGFLLTAAGFNVAVFETADSFLDALPRLDFGCVISDVRMPGTDGLTLLKRLREQARPLPTVVMTGHGDVPLAVEAMKLGALDFLEKQFEDERLVSVIEEALKLGADNAAEHAFAAELAGRIASLSPRERQVMEGLVAGLSNKVIARDYDISPRTIEVYRANVMTKMQANSVSELVRFAIKGGLVKA